MLTAPLKQTPEYKRLLAGMAGAKPAVVALFGMPPTARAQILAALCEDTGRSALVVCAGEADATRFAEDAAVFGRRAEVFPARDYVLRPVEGQIENLLGEILQRIDRGERALVTTLTVKMAEDLTDYLEEHGVHKRA